MALDIQLRLHDTLRDFARTLEIANEEVSEVELGWHIGVLGAVTHVTQPEGHGLDVEHERIKGK